MSNRLSSHPEVACKDLCFFFVLIINTNFAAVLAYEAKYLRSRDNFVSFIHVFNAVNSTTFCDGELIEVMESTVHDIIEMLEMDEGDQMEAATLDLLQFLVTSLRDAKVATVAAPGILQLMKNETYRGKLQKLGLESAVKGLHFFGPEMSELATEMIHVLKEELVVENENWRCFSFPSPQVEGDHHEVFVKVKLSTANDATRLSSHGWRVWPGAQILSQWLVSWERNLTGMKVLEAWICR